MYKKVHFIGIAGAGMSAAAKLLKDQGIAVTGSDQDAYPPVSDFLNREAIQYTTAYAPGNIPGDVDLIVIGKNAKLVPESNPEVAAAYSSGKRITSFPEVLGELSQGKQTIVVAGSFGKSTCAALLAHCLESVDFGRDLSFFIGAIPLTPSTSARLGQGALFVLEGDEYPSSNTDARSKFLHYHPRHLLITPLAHDHFNVFPTPELYLEPFRRLANLPPDGGTVVAAVEGSLSNSLLSQIARPVITYGVHDGEFQARDISWGEKTTFKLLHRGSPVAQFETTQLGEHNIQNIVGVAALLLTLKLCSAEQLCASVATFRGLKRRLDKKSEHTTVPIFEGFGSSYDKARSAIAAMKRHFPDRRLVILFEPHTFSWRNREALHWYDDVFSGAGKVFVYELASQGSATHAQSSQAEIVARVQNAGVDVEAITNAEEASPRIEAELHANDVVLILTSGNLGGLIERVQSIAEQKFPKAKSA